MSGLGCRARHVALRKESVDRNTDKLKALTETLQSLSARRAWIEILQQDESAALYPVALRKESVDRNFGGASRC